MELLARLKTRDEKAFAEAYARYGNEVYVFLRRLCGNTSLAHDLFQDTWLQLVRYAPKLRDDSNLGAWLCVVARNAFRKHRRFVLLDNERVREWRWAFSEGRSSQSSLSSEPLEFSDAIERLPVSDREIILLSLTEASPDEMAAMLGVQSAAFRQRLSRARKRLAKEIKNDS